jgi:signal transduction histidine kinase/ligand-binding sensor domain-containing protein
MVIKPLDRNLRFRTILTMILLLTLKASGWAAEYGFDAWTTANGLPQNTVTGVAQTPDGYLWLSTFDGLARFDGVRFTIFDKGNTKNILNNRFSGIFVDRDGALWAVTENGIVTVYRNGAFTSFQNLDAPNVSLGLVSDAAGNAVIESDDGFYYLQDGRLVPAADRKQRGVRTFYYGKSGAKWTFERNNIRREKDGQNTNYALDLPPAFLNASVSPFVYEDRRGALWIRFGDRLCRLADGAAATFTKNEIPAFDALTPQQIFDDADGSVWFIFGESNSTRKTDAQLVKFHADRFTSYNLNESVGGIFATTDREGNFWLATPTGLKRLRQKLITTLSVKDGLNNNEVYPLLQTGKGDVLIGTVQGVNRYRDGKITDTGLKYAEGFPLYMRGLWEDDLARIWLGYQGTGGFGRFEETAAVKKIGSDILPNGATDFAADRSGSVWIATEEGLFAYRDDRRIAHYTIKDGLRNDKIITLRFDRRGDLWLGTFDGLSQLKDGKFINFAETENSPQGFVRAIYEDPEGVLWFGTYGDGLVRYKDGRFFNYRVEDGLFNNGVFAILEDARGNFWMSSNRGIHRVRRQDLEDFADGRIPKLSSVSYDEKDGMLNAECNGGRIPAAIKTSDGRLWFATMGGVAIVDPESEKLNPNPPPSVIENISIDRKAIDPEILRSANGKRQTTIELQPGQSNVAIEYTGLSLTKSGQIRFKYKLEGLEENWVEAGTKRTADYSYLPAGTYTFRVIAANADGVWSAQEEGAEVRIVVRPYLYQTWWFRLLAGLAAALLIGVIYHSRVSHLRDIAEAKTQFSRRLLESQEAERKRIASELHDGLGQSLVVIKNRATLGIKKGDDRARVAKELDSISETASQALDEVRTITDNLRPQLLDRLGLTKALISMCKKMSGVVEVECDIAPVDDLFNESEEISVYRIVQESLNNIVKHSDASDAIVRIKRDENRVLITIEDNGKGFETTNVKNGLGLTGLKERAQLLGGEFSIDSRIGEGTKIKLELHS